MPLTQDQADALPDWTDAELVKIYRHAIAQGWAGTTRSINGRSVTFPPIESMMKVIDSFDVDDCDDLGDFSLATF